MSKIRKCSMRMSPGVDQLVEKYGMPAGFQRISWHAVKAGQEVWVYGTIHREMNYMTYQHGHAYGPHRVESVKERRLVNGKGRSFMEYQESLLVREDLTCPVLPA